MGRLWLSCRVERVRFATQGRKGVDMKRSRTQSEFGGRSGLIASAADGHVELTSREELWALYSTDPTDAASVPDRENVGERDRVWKEDWRDDAGNPGKASIA